MRFTCVHAKVITYVRFVTNDSAYHDAEEFTWTPGYAAPAPETSGSGNASSSTGPAPAVPLEVIDDQCEVEIDDAEPGCDFAPSPAEISRLKAEAVSTKHLLTHLPKNKYCEIAAEPRWRGRIVETRKIGPKFHHLLSNLESSAPPTTYSRLTS